VNDEQGLQDIATCAEEVAIYLENQTRDDYLADRMRQRAVERLLTIIGEAAKHLSRETRARIEQPWQEIIRFRDKSIHSYDALIPAIVYKIAKESLPTLHAAVTAYLRVKPM
jgi:uncharacterized protein with HEPN domain